MAYTPYAGELHPVHERIPNAHTEDRDVDRHLRFATELLGVHLPPGAKILDFGCGIGASVGAMLARGYDAFGVDVREYWGRDFDRYWLEAEKPPAEITRRLRVADPSNYQLPFDDRTFDFCFSDQVFEHVFDYPTIMSEIVRVLKPGALSIHNFPGPNNLMEGHVRLPFPWLCYSRSYLTLCALIARAPDVRAQVGGWTKLMRFNNYPTKAKLRRIAKSIGVSVQFVEVDAFLFREGSPLKGTILKNLRAIKMDRFVVRIVGMMMLQRYMVLKARTWEGTAI
jgi:SAM-dependent methyltransferase